jgi:hypothetical protein
MEPRSRPVLSPVLDRHEALLLPRLLWAASHDRSERAIAAGRLQLVTVLEAGALVYDPRAHALRALCAVDLRIPREAAAPQHGFELIYVATIGRTDPGARRALAAVDAAVVGARVERLCTAYGLWLSPRGPIEARALEACLGLEPPRFVSFVQSVGWTNELPTCP